MVIFHFFVVEFQKYHHIMNLQMKKYSGIAQLVEHLAVNQGVGGFESLSRSHTRIKEKRNWAF